MPMCIVPGCTSGYRSNPEKVHFFTVPTDCLRKAEWNKAIRGRNVKKRDAVCEKHFHSSEILWEKHILGPDGKILGVGRYKVPRLKVGSVPSIFPWTESVAPTCITPVAAEADWKQYAAPNLHTELNTTPELGIPEALHQEQQTVLATDESLAVECVEFANFENGINNNKIHCQGNKSNPSEERAPTELCFLDIVNAEVNLPQGWVKFVTGCKGKKLVMFLINETVEVEQTFGAVPLKNLVVKEDLSISIKVVGFLFNDQESFLPRSFSNITELQDIIFKLHRLNVCCGVMSSSPECKMYQTNDTLHQDASFTWRHKNCSLLVVNQKVCTRCKTAKTSLKRKLGAGSRKKKKIDDNKSRKALQAKYRRAFRIQQLNAIKMKSENVRLQSQLDQYKSQNMDELLNNKNIPQNYVLVIREMMEAAKRKDLKGQQYSEEWRLVCLLLHMQSPSSYKFLRSNNFLPLPSLRTIRRYLSKIKPTCGFDSQFFNILEIAMNKKSDSERHGILLFDEMATRESVSVDTTNLSYKGLVDFGSEDNGPSNFSEKANHGLVFMFKSLTTNFCQTIAVFASRGPVQGEVLSKLVIKAIILLEKAGAIIHGIVSDGASTNRKLWTDLGISGEKGKLRNFFDHPLTEGRKIYAFSDTPHLWKTIRNRLHNNGILQMDPLEQPIKWEYIKLLHDKDRESAGPGQALICPKLTANHINLNSSLKMRVRLAVQVFSNSVSAGLLFFRSYKPEFQGCEATAAFCKWMNDLFDALNRTQHIDGVQPGNVDFKIIEESLRKLDAWEEHIEKGNLPKEMFLTKQTAEGLRVTLKSTIDLVQYLTQECGFSYVLTGYINQDPLENFFGTLRQAGRCDDHPSTPTFLGIYRILSLFSILKPPKTGNCSTNSFAANEPLVSLADLNKIFCDSDESSERTSEVKKKLQQVLKNDDWEMASIVHATEHDYSLPPINTCLMYCLTGELIKQISNSVKCVACKDGLLQENVDIILPAAVLLEWQKRGNVIHPNTNLYLFVCFLETSFQKHCGSPFVFENLLDDVYSYKGLTFPCNLHAHDVIYMLIRIFLLKRMTTFSTRINAEQKKENQNKKKIAKFCKT